MLIQLPPLKRVKANRMGNRSRGSSSPLLSRTPDEDGPEPTREGDHDEWKEESSDEELITALGRSACRSGGPALRRCWRGWV